MPPPPAVDHTRWMPRALRGWFEDMDLSGIYKKWQRWQPDTLGADMHGYNTPVPPPPGTPGRSASKSRFDGIITRYRRASRTTGKVLIWKRPRRGPGKAATWGCGA